MFPKGPINKVAAMVQMMTWRWLDDKPLSELMVAQFTGVYMHHLASMS